jgi:hypothetical protein
MPIEIEAFEDFATGVISSVPADKIPDTAFARAFNSSFLPAVGGSRVLRPRPGLRFSAQPAATAGAYTAGLAGWTMFDGDARNEHRISVQSDGSLWNDETQIVLPTGGADFADSALDGTRWQFMEANNRLFGVSGAGDDDAFKLYRKTGISTVYAAPFGIAKPVNAPTQNTTAAGSMTGTYDFLVTYYNEHTGTESSPSDAFSVVLATNNITLNRNNSGYPVEVTHWRLYLRKQSTQTSYWRDETMEYAIATGTALIDVADADLANLITAAPREGENDPCPPGTIAICWHLSRAFATDGKDLYYSKPGNPEQFDYVARKELVNPDDGQKLVAVRPIGKKALALIKERSIYVLLGDDPETWEIPDPVSPTMGAYSRDVTEGDGMWAGWGEHGPWVWSGQGEPTLVANEVMGRYVEQGVLTTASLTTDYPVEWDSVGHRFLFAMPTTGAAAQWTVLPFNTLTKSWESGGWDLPSVRCLATMPSTSGGRRVFVGTNEKCVYELVPECRTDGAANETGADLVHTATAVTASTVAFAFSSTVPVNPRGSIVRVIDPVNLRVHRSVVTSITGTTTKTCTLTTDFPTGQVPAAGAIVVFDMPVLEWDSRRAAKRWVKKRFHRAFLELETNGDTPMLLGIYKHSEDADEPDELTRAYSLIVKRNKRDEFSAAAVPPTITDAEGNIKERIGRSGFAWWARVIGWYPLSRWSLSRVAVEVEPRNYAR